MNRSELAELIRNGESSGVEFKRDDVRPERLAREIAALLNFEGGHILLGVDDDGGIPGLARPPKRTEEWVMEVARSHVRPAAIPYWETIDCDGAVVGVVSLPADAPDKPYKAKRGSAWVTPVRVGTTTRDASDEEEARLYMQSGRLQYDRRPVPGSSLDDLDRRRLVNYFRDLRRQYCPPPDAAESWRGLLVNSELMVEDRGNVMASGAGLLLFGARPNRFLPQAGISAVAYAGAEKDYDAKARATLRGPLVPLFPAPSAEFEPAYPGLPRTFSEYHGVVETGVIESAVDFVRRHIDVQAWIDESGRRAERWDYPLETVREALVNAVAHRDYTIAVTDIELSLYADRLEIVSPGRLPNTVTVEKMRTGCRASRNELTRDVLRDYRYIEASGLGVPRKIVAGMRTHNGTEPDLTEDDYSFTVRLWKSPSSQGMRSVEVAPIPWAG